MSGRTIAIVVACVISVAMAGAVFADQAKDVFTIGEVAYKAKDYGTAYENFKKAVGLAPTSAKYQYNLGLACRKLNRYSEAVAALSEAEILDPAIGFTKDKQGFRDKLAEMRQYVVTEADEGSSGVSAGETEFADGERAYKSADYATAYDRFLKAVSMQPANAKYRYNLGLACRKLDRYTESYNAFLEAKRLDPSIGFTTKKDDFAQKLKEMEEKSMSERSQSDASSGNATTTSDSPGEKKGSPFGALPLIVAGGIASPFIYRFIRNKLAAGRSPDYGTTPAQSGNIGNTRQAGRPGKPRRHRLAGNRPFDGRYDDYHSGTRNLSSGRSGWRDHS